MDEERAAARVAMKQVVAAAVAKTEERLRAERRDELLRARQEEAELMSSLRTAREEAERAEASSDILRGELRQSAAREEELASLLEAERSAGRTLAEALGAAEADAAAEATSAAAAAREAVLAEMRESEPVEVALRAARLEHEQEVAKLTDARRAAVEEAWERAVEATLQESAAQQLAALERMRGELMAAKAAAALQLSEADARHQAEMGAERARAEAAMAAKLKAQRESLVGMAAAQLDTDALVSDAVRGALCCAPATPGLVTPPARLQVRLVSDEHSRAARQQREISRAARRAGAADRAILVREIRALETAAAMGEGHA